MAAAENVTRAQELRDAVAWFDEQRLSGSSVENFRRMVNEVADRLAPQAEGDLVCALEVVPADNVVQLHRGHSMGVVALQDREPTDEEVTRRGPYVMDSRSESDRSL